MTDMSNSVELNSTDLPEHMWMRLGLGICSARGEIFLDDYLDGLRLSAAERSAINEAIKLRCAWSIAMSDRLRERTDERDTICMLLNLSYLKRPISLSRNPYGDGTPENPYPVNSAKEAANWLTGAWPKCPTIEEPVNGKNADLQTFKVVLGPGQYSISVSFRYVS